MCMPSTETGIIQKSGEESLNLKCRHKTIPREKKWSNLTHRTEETGTPQPDVEVSLCSWEITDTWSVE